MSASEDAADFKVLSVVAVSTQAIKVELDTGDLKWVPRSVIHDDSEVYERGHSGTMLLKLWWAQSHGWLG